MNTIDKFEIMYSSDGSVIPEFVCSKHVFTPGKTYADKMPKIEAEIKIFSRDPKNIQLLSDLFDLLYRKVETETLKRGDL